MFVEMLHHVMWRHISNSFHYLTCVRSHQNIGELGFPVRVISITGYKIPRKYFASLQVSPVLPEVGSMIVSPGFRRPFFSASSTMRSPMRSLTLPPALKNSHFATVDRASEGRRRWKEEGGRRLAGILLLHRMGSHRSLHP